MQLVDNPFFCTVFLLQIIKIGVQYSTNVAKVAIKLEKHTPFGGIFIIDGAFICLMARMQSFCCKSIFFETKLQSGVYI